MSCSVLRADIACRSGSLNWSRLVRITRTGLRRRCKVVEMSHSLLCPLRPIAYNRANKSQSCRAEDHRRLLQPLRTLIDKAKSQRNSRACRQSCENRRCSDSSRLPCRPSETAATSKTPRLKRPLHACCEIRIAKSSVSAVVVSVTK